MKSSLEKYTFWLILPFLLFSIFKTHFLGSRDLNRTIGWGQDITNFVWWNTFNPLLFFLIGYGILLLLKRRTLYYLSALHWVLIILNILLIDQQSGMFIKIVSWTIFITNILLSKKLKIDSI